MSVQQSLIALGLDSLMAVELQHQVEVDLGVVLPMVAFLEEQPISDLKVRILADLEKPSLDLSFPAVQEFAADYPLSHGQRAMWFLHQLAPESGAYNIARAVKLETAVNISNLRSAFQKLIERHPALRMNFSVVRGEPVLHLHDSSELWFRVEDASDWGESTLQERLAEIAHHTFDLAQDSLLRVYVFSRSEQEHVLLLVVHHIVADFWSLAVLVRELGELYAAACQETPAQLPALTCQSVDYSQWQAEVLAGAEGKRLRSYWQQQLGGNLGVLDLPADRPRPVIQTYRGASHMLQLEGTLVEALKTLSRAHNATLYMTLLAAFQTLLYRYSGQDDILIGSPTAGREQAKWAGVLGYFVNPVVLRADLSGNPSFVTFLEQVRRTVLDAFRHQTYPFDLLVEQLQQSRVKRQLESYHASTLVFAKL